MESEYCSVCKYATRGYCGCEELIRQDERLAGSPEHADRIRAAKRDAAMNGFKGFDEYLVYALPESVHEAKRGK